MKTLTSASKSFQAAQHRLCIPQGNGDAAPTQVPNKNDRLAS